MAAQHTTSSSSLCSCVALWLQLECLRRETPGAFFEVRSGLAEGEWIGWGGACATHTLSLGEEAGDQMAQAGGQTGSENTDDSAGHSR